MEVIGGSLMSNLKMGLGVVTFLVCVNRRVMPVVAILLIGVMCAQDRVQSELRFTAHSKEERQRACG
jgi:hypothetical protein